MTQLNIVQFPDLPDNCGRCVRAASCMGLDPAGRKAEIELDVGVRTRVLHKHEKLVSDGDRFSTLYAVRSGAIKIYKTTETGEEQIIDFCLPGDLIGMDAIHSGYFQCHAVALDTSSVCALDYGDIERLCDRSPSFRKVFFNRLSAGILRNENFVVTLGTRDAYQRLAAFLVTLAEYYGGRGYSRMEFVLPMSRSDIADYLNLAVETVSRLFSRLQSRHCVRVNRSAVAILDLSSLYQAAGMQPPRSHSRAGVQ